MVEKNNQGNAADELRYGHVYEAISELYGPVKVKENRPLSWDSSQIVRFFKRFGAVPDNYSNRKSTLRVLLAAKTMAKACNVSIGEVYHTLQVFTTCSEKGLCLEYPACPRCPVAEYCKHNHRNISMKDLPVEERPCERILEKGEDNLTDSELLAILIGGGNKKENAIDLSRRLLATFRTLKRMDQAGNKELRAIKGIGKTKAARLRAAFALGRRSQSAPLGSKIPIRGSRQVFEHYRHKMSTWKKEMFLCVLMDTKHSVICEEQVAIGSLNESLVHPREVFKRAVVESAHAVLFVHNHPSGDPTPSPQDYNLTARLVKAGKLIGIKVLDHVVVGNEEYYSFAEHGELGG